MARTLPFPIRLKQAMKVRGHSQAELARILGIDPSLVCFWLSGARKPGRWTAPLLYDFYPELKV